MNVSAKKLIGALWLGISLLAAACANGDNANQNNLSNQAQASAAQQTTKDDIEELGKIIRLPVAPEEATYRADASKLIAVFKFSAADAAQIVSQAERYKAATQTEIETEDWFPAELIAQSQLSGDETLRGASFAADDFFAPPYQSGKLTRVGETDYFVLELFASP
jgi:hypothetical protein